MPDLDLTPCACGHPRHLHKGRSRKFRGPLCVMAGCPCNGFVKAEHETVAKWLEALPPFQKWDGTWK